MCAEEFFIAAEKLRDTFPNAIRIYSGPSQASESETSIFTEWIEVKQTESTAARELQSLETQSKQVLKGLEGKSPGSVCIRLRTDFIVRDPNALAIALAEVRSRRSSPPLSTGLTLVSSGTRDVMRLPHPYHFSDFVQIGTVETVAKYWEGGLRAVAEFQNELTVDRQNFRSFSPDSKCKLNPEQILAFAFLESPESFALQAREGGNFASFYRSEKALRSRIILTELSSIGVTQPENIFSHAILQKSQFNLRGSMRLPVVLRATFGFLLARYFFWTKVIWLSSRRRKPKYFG